MDAKEVNTRIQSLQKALAEKQPASVIINMLETLKKEVVPTEELLRVRRTDTARSHSSECIWTPVCATSLSATKTD